MRIPRDGDLALAATQLPAVHERRTTQQPPDERAPTLLRVALAEIAIDGAEPGLEAGAQRAREDAAADGAAEAAGEAAEGPDQARGHVVGARRRQVQHVREGVVEGRAGAEAVGEQDEDVHRRHGHRP